MSDIDSSGFRILLPEDFIEQVADRVRTRPEKRILTVAEAAVYLGRSQHAVRQMVRSRKIPVVKIDQRVMFDVHDLDKLIESSKER